MDIMEYTPPKTSRPRGSNLSSYERALIITLAKQHPILKVKLCDKRTNLKKQRAWDLITEKFNSDPIVTKRNAQQVRVAWTNTKYKTRRNSKLDYLEKTEHGTCKAEGTSSVTSDIRNSFDYDEPPLDIIINSGEPSLTSNNDSKSGMACDFMDPIDTNKTIDSKGSTYKVQVTHENNSSKIEVEQNNSVSGEPSTTSYKRHRSQNFTRSEAEILFKVAKKYEDIINNKNVDRVTNKRKEIAWSRIAKEFNALSKYTPRCDKSLKNRYQNGHRFKLPREEKKVVVIHDDESSNEMDFNNSNDRFDENNYSGNYTNHLNSGGQNATVNDNKLTVQMPKTVFIQENGVINGVMIKAEPVTPEPETNNFTPINNEDCTNKKKPSVISQKLCNARLELIELKKELARQELKNKASEHDLQMQHLHREELRRQEIHTLMMNFLEELINK